MADILVLSFSRISSDPRVSRQIRALASRHHVMSCGYGPAPRDVRHHIEVRASGRTLPAAMVAGVALKLGLHDWVYWALPRMRSTRSLLLKHSFDLVLANDVEALPLALEVARGAPVLFDAHEYAPLEYEDSFRWRFFFARHMHDLCARYLPKTAMMTTVSQGIAERYSAESGVRAEVITNAAGYRKFPVRQTDPSAIRMVHHGAGHPSRHTESMIDLMDHLDERYSLDLLLVPGDAGYIERLRRRAARHPRIRFLEPVPMEQLVAVSSAYDVGLLLLPPDNFNNRMALPNKFFEYLQARLAIVIGPSPEMARLVRQFSCGVVGEKPDVRALADVLNRTTHRDFDSMKRGADRAAQVLNAEANEERLRLLVHRLLHVEAAPSVMVPAQRT